MIRMRMTLLFSAALLLTVAAVVVSVKGAELQPHPPFTQAWMLPGGATDPGAITVGLSSHEAAATTYRIQLKVGPAVVQEWEAIRLAPGSSWKAKLVLPPGDVEALIFRQNDSSVVYRHLIVRASLRPVPAAPGTHASPRS